MADKILLMIIDDDPDDRWLFIRAVNSISKEYEYLQAHDGSNAIELLQAAAQLPAYIFLDLNMPRMNGKECLVEIKKHAALKDIPVIIYSTSDYAKDLEFTLQHGAAYYLPKPVDMKLLPAAIMAAIKEAGNTSGRH